MISPIPESHRPTWARCTEPRLTQMFQDCEPSVSLCRHLIGEFDFKHHDGKGFFTFAPRFHKWALSPRSHMGGAARDVLTVPPYNVNELPSTVTEFGRSFLTNASRLGISLAPSWDSNWHTDGIDDNFTASFSVLWGSLDTCSSRQHGEFECVPRFAPCFGSSDVRKRSVLVLGHKERTEKRPLRQRSFPN